MSVLVRVVAVLMLAAFGPACRFINRPAKVTFASDPPGARIVVDNRDSGFVTPSVLALDTNEDIKIELVYPGYRTATRVLTPGTRFDVILWRDMFIRSGLFYFPLWLNTRDIFVPFKYSHPLAPGRVHVRLERAADST
jgi:hypothetical protein